MSNETEKKVNPKLKSFTEKRELMIKLAQLFNLDMKNLIIKEYKMEKISKEELAAKLHGMEYGSDIPKELLALSKENKLVICYGYSDDLLELEGAIRDEGSCWDGGKFMVLKAGVTVEGYDEDEDEDVEIRLDEDGIIPVGEDSTAENIIEAVWCDKSHEPFAAWTLKTDIPHATFHIKEDEDIQSIGIVFSMDDLK